MGWVDDVVAGVKETYGTTNPFELCDHLNITLCKTDDNCFFMSGQKCVYVRNIHGREFILYVHGLRYNRLKFYIMHEIGHALLHPDVRYSLLVNNHKLEKQANYFALCMLLPAEVEYYTDKAIQLIAMEHDIPENVFRVG